MKFGGRGGELRKRFKWWVENAVFGVRKTFLVALILTTLIVPVRGLVGGLSGLAWRAEAQMGRLGGERIHADPAEGRRT